MVGKSNKFDFTNRSNSGSPLAKVISDAFEKELEKAKKDASRQAKKVSKHGIDPARDISVHIIDMKLPQKDLGDQGLLIMVRGMTNALLGSSEAASLVLQHMDLQGNNITAHGCFTLVSVLNACKSTLKTLDLSNNAIAVDSERTRLPWEMFVRAIVRNHKDCKINLSGNRLGFRAWETLARVCVEENVHRPGEDCGIGRLKSDELDGTLAVDLEDDAAVTTMLSKASCTSPALLKTGIPFLDITNTGLDDASALWLSYLFPANITTTAEHEQSETSDPVVESTVIDWKLAGDLTKDGLQLLRWVEELTLEKTQRELAVPAVRRASGRHSISGADSNDVLVLRHKMQRQIIQQMGTQHVMLWDLALRVLVTSRSLLVLASKRRTKSQLRKPAALPVLADISNLSIRSTDEACVVPGLRSKSNRAFAYREWQEKRQQTYRSDTACGLSLPIFRQICMVAVGFYATKKLNDVQLEAVYYWGQQRATLSTERAWVKMTESAQKLTLLDSIKCLAYVV